MMFKFFALLLLLIVIIHVESANPAEKVHFGAAKVAQVDGSHESEYYDDEYYDDDDHHAHPTTHAPTTRRRRTTAHHVTAHHTTRRRRTTAHAGPHPPATTPKPKPASHIDGGLIVSILGTLRSPNGTAYAFNQTFILSPQ